MATNDQDYQSGMQQSQGQLTGYASGGRRLDMLTEFDLRRIIREEVNAILQRPVFKPTESGSNWCANCGSLRDEHDAYCCSRAP